MHRVSLEGLNSLAHVTVVQNLRDKLLQTSSTPKETSLLGRYDMTDFKATMLFCLANAHIGISHHYHYKLLSFLTECNRTNILTTLVAMNLDVSQYMGNDANVYKDVVHYFRRYTDHPLSHLVDIAQFVTLSTLTELIHWLKIPTPDTTHIFLNYAQREECVMRHMVHLIVGGEDTSRCIKYIKLRLTRLETQIGLDKNEGLIVSTLPLTSVMQKINSSFGNMLHSSPNYLAQLTILKAANDMKTAVPVLNWLTQYMSPTELSSATYMAALLKQNTAVCRIVRENITLTIEEFTWILHYCHPDIVKFCIEDKSVKLGRNITQTAFDRCMETNSVQVGSVIYLLKSQQVVCKAEHLTAAATFCNQPILHALLPYCVKWNQTDVVDAVRNIHMRSITERDHNTMMITVYKIFHAYISNALVQNPTQPEKSQQAEICQKPDMCEKPHSIKVSVITSTGNVNRSSKH